MKTRLVFFFSLILLFSACEKDEELTDDLNARLTFSMDSVLFDTVFTSIGSTSRRLKIYNPNEKAVLITQIKLDGASSSAFSLNINGQPSTELNLLKLNGRDSMNIFVKVNINPDDQTAPFLVKDAISISYHAQKKNISLVAYGQNANFIVNDNIRTATTWSSKLPYIIYKSLTVDEGATLNIAAGTKVLFHSNATLNVKGTLKVAGTQKDSVTFASDRLEQYYANEPGQWNGLHFYPQSKNSHINFAVVKNAVVGITVDSLSTTQQPKLLLTNTVVKNMTVVGLLGYQTSLTGFNNLFYNCGQYLVYLAGGGRFNFKQNTFAGYNTNLTRKTPALYFTDFISSKQADNLTIDLQNNIIWGMLPDELVIEQKAASTALVATINNNLIRTTTTGYGTTGNLVNIEPGFINPFNGNFRLQKNSQTLNKGVNLSADPYFSTFLATDLKNNERLFPSDLGCYENN